MLLTKYDVAVIGGGILGGSISYWISALYDLKICVIDKEHQVSMHASSRNTNVVHSPFYLNPETKGVLAKSAIISYTMWENLAKDRNIPWLKTGVYEIGFNDKQYKDLEEFMEWADINGIPKGNMELLDGKEIAKREPNVKCHSGVFCKREVSTDFGDFTREICKDSEKKWYKIFAKSQCKIN